MNLQNLTTRAKVLLGAIIVGAVSMQVDQVKDVVMPLVANHPHLSSIAAGAFSVVAVLQNPVVQKVLGIEEHTESVRLPDGTEATTTNTKSTLTKDA